MHWIVIDDERSNQCGLPESHSMRWRILPDYHRRSVTVIGASADPEVLDRDRMYVRLTSERGCLFHYTYLDELEPLRQSKFRLSKGCRLSRGDTVNALNYSKLLSFVDESGREISDHSLLRRLRMEPPMEGEIAPWFGPIEISFILRDRRMFRTDVYRATFLCPAERGYLFESHFVSRMLAERLERFSYGKVPAHHVAPYFLIDDLIGAFFRLLRNIELSKREQYEPISARIETYLQRHFVSMNLFATVCGDAEMVARRLYGISDRLHIALASIARTLVDVALHGNAFARDFVVSEVWRLFPEDTPVPPKVVQRPSQEATPTQSQTSKNPTAGPDGGGETGQSDRAKIDRADDANETARITISAITSALTRTFPGVEPLAATGRLKASTPDDEATKRNIAMILKQTAPASAESTHRWCVELLPKALALIAQQGK